METAAPVVRRLESFWCYDGTTGVKHDKVYRLEMQEFKERCSITALYGRRGKPLILHIVAEEGLWWSTKEVFDKKVAELLKKGYVRVNEDVAETANLTVKEGAWA